MKFEPMSDRILVRRIEAEEKSPGGILIPDAAKEKPIEGTVVAVGPGKLERGNHIRIPLEVGDRILFGKYAGTEIKLNGEAHVVLREDEVFGVFRS